MIAVESLSTSPGIEDKTQSQELQKDFPCKTAEEVDILGITSEGEQLEIEEFSIFMTTNPSCDQTTAQLEEEGLYDIMKGGEYQDYIERWF